MLLRALPTKSLLLACMAFLMLAASGPAQDTTGTITGTVMDPSHALIQGATITLNNLEQGTSRKMLSNHDGIYEFRFLPPGRYSVAATQAGFKQLVKNGLTLTVGQTMRVDLALQLGDVNQSVSVTDTNAELLKAESSEVSQVITTKQVEDLPLNGRNFADLIPLNAGVTTGIPGESNGGYNMNGSRSDSNDFVVEGQDNTDINHNLLIQPPIDSIQEFQIQTGNFSAAYGETGGGIVSVQLKSGSNQFHGSAFEFLRNDLLDANNFFANDLPLQPGQTHAERLPLRQNQFGGTLGGPIIHDKTFFFVDYQGTRSSQGGTTIQNVPTALERQGDFSQTLAPGQPLYNDMLLGTVFPNQMIPSSALDPAAVKIANLYPLPNTPGTFIPGQGTINNYTASGTTTNDVDQFDVKLDHYFSTKDILSGHYSFAHGTQVIPAAFGGGTVGPCIGCSTVLDLLAGSPQNRAQLAGITETHSFSPALVNEFRIGVTRNWTLYQTADGGKDLATQVGIANVNVSPSTTGLPWFDFSPSPSWTGTSPFTPAIGGYTDWETSDNVSLLRGRHSIKMGFDMQRRANNGVGNFFGKGAYIFTPFFTGNAFADFLTGRPLVIEQSLTPGTTGLRGQQYGMYIQDDFKVNSRLTLNLGLRYDLFPGYYEDHDRLTNIDPIAGVVQLAGRNGVPRSFYNTNYLNFAPRFGFAYSLNSKTVVRGGYGISYLDANNFVSYVGANPPFTQSFNLTNISFTTFDAIVHISDGLPTYLAPTVASFDTHNPSGTFDEVDAHAHTPYTQSFNLTLERTLPGSILVEAAYVGTKGTYLPGEIDGDPATPGPTATEQQRRVYYASIPNVTGITYMVDAFSSIYHSMQLKAEKRFSHGLQFLSTYTFAKSIDSKSGSAVTGGGNTNPSSMPEDPFNWSLDRALSSFDVRQRFVAAFNYNLPFGRGLMWGANWNRAVDWVLGGWQVNGILTAQSGLPFTVFASSNAQCGCSSGDMRANLIGNPLPSNFHQSIQGWFDPAAFTDPAPLQYGTAGRNIIEGPGLVNLDFSLFKKFPFGEGRMVQLRGEFFNVLNHPNFLNPTNTADAIWNSGGIITDARPARVGQVAVKIIF